MMPNTDPIVPQLRQKFEILIDYVSGSERATHAIYRVEVHLFRQLLTLGALLLRLFVRTRAGVRPAAPTTPDGVVMRFGSSIFLELPLPDIESSSSRFTLSRVS